MDLRNAKELYDILNKISNQAFDIVFANEDAEKAKSNKESLGTNLDQYLQCVLVKCLLEKEALNEEYFDIVKTLTNFDAFINIPVLSSEYITKEELESYVNNVVASVPLFIKLVVHIDGVCAENDPSFDTKLSRDAFSCLVEIVKSIVPYQKVNEIAVCLYEAVRPVISAYQEAKLKYYKEDVIDEK